jgi:hypothetical protein
MKKVSEVKVLPGYRLQLEFDDGVSGTVDLSEAVGKVVFGIGATRLGKKPEDTFPALRDQPTRA